MSSFAQNSPDKMDFQGLKRVDGKKIGLRHNRGMSQKHKDGKNSPIARRLRAIMLAENIKSQEVFAKKLNTDKKRLNNPMMGYPLSIDMAQRIKEVVPGMTRDWLYDGDEAALPVSLRDRLREAESRLTGLDEGAVS